jgi:glycosyltransferase involved in cell wall biosynthesis
LSTSPRHLGYVLKRFPRISETFIAAELIELERQGERVTVFALSRPNEPFRHAFVDELRARVIYLANRPLLQPVRTLRALAHLLRTSPRGWLRAARASLLPLRLTGSRHLLQATVLRQELERAGIHHVHAHFASTAAGLAHLAWLMGGPSYSFTAHAKDIYHDDVRRDRLRERLLGATFVATVTEANAAYLEAVTNGAGRIRVVHNAVDLRRLGTANGDGRKADVVLTVARLIEKKGIRDVVAACGILARRGVALRLEIVGDGPLRRELEAAAARKGVRAVFHGPLPHERVLELYRHATVFCLPSVVAASGDRDGLPTSILEAMALDVPVVATSLNGLGEAVVHERTGLIVPGGDPPALADALERVLSDSGLRAALAPAARRHVEERFSLDRSVRELRSLFPEAS